MNLVYGSYQHEAGDAEVIITKEGLVSDLGVQYAVRERWDVNGRLHAANTTAVNSAVSALMDAYSSNYQDIYINGSSHIMRSSDTINGTRVVVPPSFPEGSGGENSTYRSYALSVEGDFAYVGQTVLLSWMETISFHGTGGPVWNFLECLNGPPQAQILQQQSVVRCKQSGSARAVPANSYQRNDYGGYWPVPSPLWAQWEHEERRTIVYELPSDINGTRVTSWSYEFSMDTTYPGLPGGSSGVIQHLG